MKELLLQKGLYPYLSEPWGPHLSAFCDHETFGYSWVAQRALKPSVELLLSAIGLTITYILCPIDNSMGICVVKTEAK